MDYLDPKKKRAHARMLYIGYILFAIAIAFATTILVYVTNGYYVDRKTGEVIQNGLVYVDSKPESAEVTLNGTPQGSRTDAKLTIPAGEHTIELSRDGYRPWKRVLQLEGGSLRRLTYARLIPEELSQQQVVDFTEQPSSMLQSLDRRWIISSTPNSTSFQLYDTKNPKQTPTTLTLPATVLTKKAPFTVQFVAWDDDNKVVLSKVLAGDGTYEYIRIDREKPEASINLDLLFGRKIEDILFRDRKHDQFYVIDTSSDGTKRISPALVTTGTIGEPLLSGFIKVKPYEQDSFAYISKTATTATGKVEVRLKDGDKDILVKEITEDQQSGYLLELAKLERGLVLAVASPAEGRAMVFRNPIGYMNSNPTAKLPLITATLRLDNPTELSFSVDATTVLARNGQDFVTYEIEEDKVYKFLAQQQLDLQKIEWMDGQHFYAFSQGMLVLSDFDGSNQEVLVPAYNGYNVFFNENYEKLFSMSIPRDELSWRLDLTELRSARDL